ncbi:MAG: 2-amino-4-hydroxy-6-hydroxymethyldihydropteridine diphosphokinase [Bacteroidia bacterium]|nr:2-amino-4-hydroxy-6-hydroxymethyldihydropteridine diphosphokinase [Bacteroidia bacterium]NNC86365.1 2-amino-4-hydroxy-6-hydroxymethyldihydropteridine diphosphokinase [Bacteroidia bacterium]
MKKAFLHLGSNEGDRYEHLNNAIHAIEQRLGAVHQKSSVYETEPWGEKEQLPFLNIALEIETHLLPHKLLLEINKIEDESGRTRTKKWGSRILDIDILFINNEVIKDEKLTIPHPYIEKRNFVMVPLNEIAGELIHPILNQNIAALLKESTDTCEVKLWNANIDTEK